jgi:hypothetical protein
MKLPVLRAIQVTASCRRSNWIALTLDYPLRGNFIDTPVESCCPHCVSFIVWNGPLPSCRLSWPNHRTVQLVGGLLLRHPVGGSIIATVLPSTPMILATGHSTGGRSTQTTPRYMKLPPVLRTDFRGGEGWRFWAAWGSAGLTDPAPGLRSRFSARRNCAANVSWPVT